MNRNFPSLTTTQFDLLIIGGGIYGAWTAYDAALRGLKVAIVEQSDWAGATSSASTKLIHGGLRYLETYDFRLVRKALKERQMLLEAAPHRVWPLRFGVPVYANSRVGRVQLMAGLTLYDLLAGGTDMAMRHHHFDAEAFVGRFPFLASDELQGGFTYADAQTDDGRLVLELIDGAMAAGAVCVNYCRLTEVVEEQGRAYGAMVQDQLSGEQQQITARQIVSTVGQWTATTAEEARAWCRLSKGVHLVLPALPGDEALLLTAPSDGRVFFAIPWYGRTLLGTTDTDYQGDINHVAVEEDDVAYLLAAANHYLKSAWTPADIIGSYAGLRVLKQNDASSPSAASRDWELKTAGNGVLSSVGGKITSARQDAARIVDAVCAQLGSANPCPTRGKSLPWTPQEKYSAWVESTSAEAARLGVDAESTKWLLRRHGKRAGDVLGLIEQAPHLAERIVADVPLVHADLLYCARKEMVVHLDDLLRRRLPLLILAKLNVHDLHRIANTIAGELGWDDARLGHELERLMRSTQFARPESVP